MAGNSADQGRSVTAKVAALITEFTRGRSLHLTELACRTGLSTSTAHRLLHELARGGLLSRDPEGAFRPGHVLDDLSGGFAARPTFEERGPHVVVDLVEVLRRPVRLGMLDQLEVSYIEKIPGHDPVTSFGPAARLPAHATALGKALLAFASAETLQLVAAGNLAARTRHTVIRADELLEALARVRRDGYAISRGELMLNRDAVAVPVLGPDGLARAAIEVELDPTTGSAGTDLLPALRLAASALAREVHPEPRRRAPLLGEHVVDDDGTRFAAG